MIKIFFDFHDVFVNSSEAWLSALKKLNAPKESLVDYENRLSKKTICSKYNISYDKLETEYRKLLKPIDDNIQFAKKLSYYVEINVLSASRKDRLIKDIKKFSLDSIFTNIFSKDDVKNKDAFLIDNSREIEWVIYFNHDNSSILINGNIVKIPINFNVDRNLIEGINYDELAKNKLLYNELSKYYMFSIANDTKKECDFIESIINNKKVEKILDCCCGVGRHSYELAKRGYYVTGIDCSKSQIINARKMHSHRNVQYEIMDVSNIVLKEQYDVAICMWSTYNYFSTDDSLKTFVYNVWKKLKTGGYLILDSKNIPSLEKKRVYIRTKNINDNCTLTLIINKDIDNMTQNSQYLYFINDNNRKDFYLDYEHIRFYRLNELQEIVKDLFEIIEIYGDYDGSCYEEENSGRFITVLRRKEEI